ncbi:MAG TPA: DnaB-like helicase C-terminal domain-containing protein [Longimicrobiaceae bacterium]|nr:DnaB-like helicase C-terminal domain-containing protein [Longimicrobiaceae bacterium]
MPDFTPVGSLLDSVLGAGVPTPAPAAAPGALLSGLPALDGLTGGWRAGELVLVTGAPGAGKSALLYAQALHASAAGARVALAPLKHTERICLWRLTSALAGVELQGLMRGDLALAARDAIAAAAERLGRLPLHLMMRAEPTVEDVAEEALRLHRTQPLALLAVDGVQALGVRGEEAEPMPRLARLAHVALALREVARTLDVPLLASLGPEGDVERLASAADRVLHVGAADGRTGIATLELRQDGAALGTARLRFDARHLRFAPAVEESAPPPQPPD